jgi:hypothetical protein
VADPRIAVTSRTPSNSDPGTPGTRANERQLYDGAPSGIMGDALYLKANLFAGIGRLM